MATTKGGGIGTNPSKIIAWQGNWMGGIFAMWHSGSPGSMIRIIGSSLHPYKREKLESSSNTVRAIKPSPYISHP